MGSSALNLILLACVSLFLTKCALDNLLCTENKSFFIYAAGYSFLSVVAIVAALSVLIIWVFG